MDIATIQTLVSGLGFPIVMVGAMSYYIKYLNDQHKEEVENINKRYVEQVEKLTEALNNNTQVMTEIKAVLFKNGGIEHESSTSETD